MDSKLPESYEELAAKFDAGGSITVVIPFYTKGVFTRNARRVERLENLVYREGFFQRALALLYMIYFELRLFIVTRGNRQLTAAVLIHQVAYKHIERTEREVLPGGDLRITFRGQKSRGQTELARVSRTSNKGDNTPEEMSSETKNLYPRV